LRPSAKQFNIYYGASGISRYEPDFIVETADVIYMCETKAANEIATSLRNKSGDVWEKAVAAIEYCRAVTEWNVENGGKPWSYVLISHDEVNLQSSFGYLVKNKIPYEQLTIEIT
jgi:type III restriction enzyme